MVEKFFSVRRNKNISLPCSQQPATGPYPMPDESSPVLGSLLEIKSLITPQKFVQAIALLICILEIPGSNLGRSFIMRSFLFISQRRRMSGLYLSLGYDHFDIPSSSCLQLRRYVLRLLAASLNQSLCMCNIQHIIYWCLCMFSYSYRFTLYALSYHKPNAIFPDLFCSQHPHSHASRL